MIEIIKVCKKYGDLEAIHDVSAQIKEGGVFGLVGTNGAGKSTLLRILAGVLSPDTGTVILDGQAIYENEENKKDIFFISDEQYFFPNSSPKNLMDYYGLIYQKFDKEKFEQYIGKLGLDLKRNLNTFSKGMRRQVFMLLGVCANTKYLLCDETFDGLDPLMRKAIKSILADEIINRDFTPIIASHSLRELEDICDHVGLLHKGGILFSRDMDEMKHDIHKVQCVIPQEHREVEMLRELDIISSTKQGSLLTITVRGNRQQILKQVEEKEAVFCEILPLSLEEIFISETEVAGYDIKNLIF